MPGSLLGPLTTPMPVLLGACGCGRVQRITTKIGCRRIDAARVTSALPRCSASAPRPFITQFNHRRRARKQFSTASHESSRASPLHGTHCASFRASLPTVTNWREGSRSLRCAPDAAHDELGTCRPGRAPNISSVLLAAVQAAFFLYMRLVPTVLGLVAHSCAARRRLSAYWPLAGSSWSTRWRAP